MNCEHPVYVRRCTRSLSPTIARRLSITVITCGLVMMLAIATPGARTTAAILVLATLCGGCANPTERLPMRPAAVQTVPDLGRAQGAATVDGKIYLYGDAATGIVREFE